MIEGESVQLRPMQVSDTDDVIRMRRAPEVLAQLFSNEAPTREEHLRWLERIHEQVDREEFVIVERATDSSIGTVGLSNIDRRHRHAQYGILIGAIDARGKGLAFEASRLILGYAFDKLGLQRVYLYVFADNEQALHLYRKVGFEEEGRLRQHIYKNGRFRDVLVMAILREEKRDEI